MTNLDAFREKRVLVVGGAGFVGSNLVRTLLRGSPAQVRVIDNLLSAERSNVPRDDRVELVEGSITDDRILAALSDDLDYVFHLATYHGNQSSIANPLEDHENNTLTTLKLYERIKGFKRIARLVYSSAGCTVAEKTYGEAHATDEDAPVSLWHDSPYQMSKIIGELYSNYYFSRHGLPVVKVRFQNVYGPGEILGAGRWRGTPATVWRNVTPTFVYRALSRLPLTVENQGQATRDFIYVDDIVDGLIAAAVRGTAGEVYNLASGVETSILDLATTINALAQNPTPIEYLPPRPWDRSGHRFGSTEKSRQKLGFEARTTIHQGLERTLAWTREHLAEIEGCMARHAEAMARAGAPLPRLGQA
ncbi:MAG: NAD-dependent epimerase/dehydratase family protein [Deltaproteobacteria bacterium]|nr:NAD-dependent epimerase/dehydratase family protein [Deltaproteobacteria bacterium]